ncbi:hypothetical protein SLEP1_g60403 [Rubroshorea leprosula]|uniref:Uncharacterized protein n=1 Tax=Rubroshorea leprosula TaxID=152421 RepID=A0AAV5MVP6_9ROSI|nr:hypothetical protein SLEP1_g60403 [Rubroshorea leprosula]
MLTNGRQQELTESLSHQSIHLNLGSHITKSQSNLSSDTTKSVTPQNSNPRTWQTPCTRETGPTSAQGLKLIQITI